MRACAYAHHVKDIASFHAVDYQLLARQVLTIGTTLTIALFTAYRAERTCGAASATCAEVVAWLHACMTFT